VTLPHLPNLLESPLDAIALDQTLRLEDLINREALTEMLRSFYALFGIPLRIYSGENLLLGDAGKEHEVCTYVNTLMKGRAACSKTVGEVKGLDAGEAGDALQSCFTGAHYRVVAIEYDGRRIGRLIVGPYLPATTAEAPPSLLQIDSALVPERAKSLLLKMPRAREETIARIAQHLKATLDLILFSGHKALLTSTMHLASVKESYRELQEKNAKLQETYDRLKELDRLKSNFLATVSHELRTPLTSIIGYSEMLSEGIAGELHGEQKEFVGTIHEKGEQLLQLIMSLLDLSKLESGTLSMKRKPTAIAPVLAEVVSTISPSARKKGVTLKLETDPKLVELRADPERLRQVFINLCDNALKFTPRGGTVTMTARTVYGSSDSRAEDDDGFALLAPVQAKVEVRIIDTGIGIPPKEREKVFDAFYQVDSSSTREYGGTGLGLSIVKRIVTAHHGTIVIEDNHPQGAIFVVTIPASSAPAANGRTIPPNVP
jgi:two-component system, NarL family, sensor histidine kinase BarA